MIAPIFRVAPVLLLLAAGPAFGHADHLSSEPPRETVLDAVPAEVQVTYTEPVETRFSIFKVYPLEHPSLDGAVLIQPDFLRLNGLAGLLVADVLQRRDDADARVDLGLMDPEPRTDAISLRLKPDLGPGAYVVMWRVLAADTHPTQGYFVFVVAPEGRPAGDDTEADDGHEDGPPPTDGAPDAY